MKYAIYDEHLAQVLTGFDRKSDCRNWLMEGMFGTDGAEREHYCDMLGQLESGRTTLLYWNDGSAR